MQEDAAGRHRLPIEFEKMEEPFVAAQKVRPNEETTGLEEVLSARAEQRRDRG